MKETKKEMTLKAAIACAAAEVVGMYMLLGEPVFTTPKTPTVIKEKITEVVKKRVI